MKSENAALNPSAPPLLYLSILTLLEIGYLYMRWVGDSRILILLTKTIFFLINFLTHHLDLFSKQRRGNFQLNFKFTPPQHTTRILSLCVQRCWCPHCLCGDDPAVSKLHKVCRERFIYPPPSTLPGGTFSLFCDHSISSPMFNSQPVLFTTLAEQLRMIGWLAIGKYLDRKPKTYSSLLLKLKF